MNEQILKEQLVLLARKSLDGFVVLRHEDRITHGIPDISITGKGRTFWLEVKYADPDFDSPGIQELTMIRLAAVTLARYIVYYNHKGEQWTYIVSPRFIGANRATWGERIPGFDHSFVVTYVKESIV